MRILKYNKLNNIFILIFLLNGIHYAQEPGDIIVAELMEFMMAEAIQAELEDEIEEFDLPWNIEYDVSLYRLEYYTTDPWDNLTIASGVLAVPGGVNQNYPIIILKKEYDIPVEQILWIILITISGLSIR